VRWRIVDGIWEFQAMLAALERSVRPAQQRPAEDEPAP
jgi:hypothetical protein